MCVLCCEIEKAEDAHEAKVVTEGEAMTPEQKVWDERVELAKRDRCDITMHSETILARDAYTKELEGRLCKAEELIANAGMHDSSCKVDEGDECSCSQFPSPCRHEEEAKRKTAECTLLFDDGVQVREENKRLREAVEWACAELERESKADVLLSLNAECRKIQEGLGNIIRTRLANFATELRRRAGGGVMKIERCCACGDPTDRAGRADDSLYTSEGIGPFCSSCYDGALHVEKVYKEMLARKTSECTAFFDDGVLKGKRIKQLEIGYDELRTVCNRLMPGGK